jgi:LacI family fructose operon transcriptional repressor
MARHGLDARVRAVLPNAEAAEAGCLSWLAEPERPDALVLSNGQILMGAFRAARGLSLRVPTDLALAGFDNEPWTDLVDPGLTVVAQPVAEIGAQAMRLLFERIADPDQPVRKVTLSGRPIFRGSTGA